MALEPAALEAALAKDDVGALSTAIQHQCLHIGAFYDWQDHKHGRQRRDLLSMACSACAPTCVAALLSAGADCNAQSPTDGSTALHIACTSASSSTARIIALLVRGGADKLLRNHAGHTACELLTQETSQVSRGRVGCAERRGSAGGHFPPFPAAALRACRSPPHGTGPCSRLPHQSRLPLPFLPAAAGGCSLRRGCSGGGGRGG